MTDGILLAETQGDRLLAAYDTLIIDEAHERSLNIDFLLGLPEAAPAAAARSQGHRHLGDARRRALRAPFRDARAPRRSSRCRAACIPVEIRYRPLKSDEAEADDEEELEDAIVAAAEDLWREGPGDILVFLPGEREIRETGELLREGARAPAVCRRRRDPAALRAPRRPEQQRVFAPSRGRRIVLATNVAETSLTVPGIRYVIDAGLARVKRYSLRNKTTLLAIERVSQAAANQRAGRCGRVADGICVRLYGEDDFAARPAYTDPEILRSSLAAVILRMESLRLGAVDALSVPRAAVAAGDRRRLPAAAGARRRRR